MSPWKVEIRPFLTAISSAIYSGSWQLTTDTGHSIEISFGRIFDIRPSFVSRDFEVGTKRHLRRVNRQSPYGVGLIFLSCFRCLISEVPEQISTKLGHIQLWLLFEKFGPNYPQAFTPTVYKKQKLSHSFVASCIFHLPSDCWRTAAAPTLVSRNRLIYCRIDLQLYTDSVFFVVVIKDL